MKISFDYLVQSLRRKTALQKTPIQYDNEEYSYLIVDGVKALLVDFGYSDLFESYCDVSNFQIIHDLTISQEEYILNAAMISFYQVVQQDVNNIVGYSTDSLQVTNADKPYANISYEIDKLRDRQAELFYKIKAEGIEW